ncbi:MAG: LysR family transcriptional regulator [Pseudomonadota bacterium]
MKVDTLQLFVEVARRLSFAAVAESRGVNPSSVSRVIGQLEANLGVRLFQRTTRSMTLTEAGELYLQRVAAVLEELDQAQEQARQLDSGPRGTLRLTASVAFGERVIVPRTPRFQARYPDVALELLFTDDNLDLVREGIDLAVRLTPMMSGDVVATRLCPTAYRVVASPAYLDRAPPVREPQDLTEHACCVFALPAFRGEWTYRPRRGDSEGAPGTVAIRSHLVVSSALSLRSLVLAGAGPALLADWLIRDDLASGALVDLLPAYEVTATRFDTAAWLAMPSRAYLPQRVRVMIDFLKEECSPGGWQPV